MRFLRQNVNNKQIMDKKELKTSASSFSGIPIVTIKSVMNGKVLTISEGQNHTQLNSLIVAQYTGSPKQHFGIKEVSQDMIIIQSLYTDRVLDVEKESTNIYTAVIAFPLHGKENQMWRIKKTEECCLLQNSFSCLVMEIYGGIDHEWMPVIQNKRGKDPKKSQGWLIDEVKYK